MSYYYVEYARAKRAIFIALIFVGFFFLAAAVLRVSVHNGHWAADLETSPTAHVTRTQLPGGSVREVIDDPQRETHAVIIRHPGGVLDMDVVEPRASGGVRHHGDFVMGSTSIHETVEGKNLHTVLHYVGGTPSFDLGVCFLFTLPMGLIVASILGGVLSKENDGHLELAWTKPVSRERYALAAMAVDAVTIVVSQLLALAVALIAALMFVLPHFSYARTFGWYIFLAMAAPVAWYALITAASASIKRGPGVVIGVAWVAAILVPSLGHALEAVASLNPIAAWFYAIFKGLSYIDPIAYLSFNGGHSYLMPVWEGAWVLCALAIGYLALAVAQWRRVEA